MMVVVFVEGGNPAPCTLTGASCRRRRDDVVAVEPVYVRVDEKPSAVSGDFR